MALKVKICNIDTSTLPKLKAKESNELLEKFKRDNDLEAREQLIIGNIRLVLSMLRRFDDSKAKADDLFQAGVIGLIKSIDNFDMGYGVQFSTYAVPMILGEIKKLIRDTSAIKINRATRDIAFKSMQAKEKLTTNLSTPSLMEVAQEIGLTEWDVVCALDAVTEPMSLYTPTNCEKDDNLLLLDQIADPTYTEENVVERQLLQECIEHLPEREKKVIKLRYYIGKTQVEISQAIGISQAQVSRLEKTAIARIKNSFH